MKVKLERETCISCGSCVAAAPEDFEIADDGLATLIGGKGDDKLMEKTLDADAARKEKLKNAETSCPVDIIHVEE